MEDSATTTATETVKLTFPDGTEMELTPDELAERMAFRKALPESLWMTGNIRYVERGYIPKAGAFEPVYIVVTELPPAVRRIEYQSDFLHYSGAMKTAMVSTPFILNVFVFQVGQDGRLTLNRMWPLSFYRNLPLSGFSDELMVCNLPNVRIDPWNDSANQAAIGWTCYHNASPSVTTIKPYPAVSGASGESEISSLSRIVKNCLDYFLESSFTGSAGATTAWQETAKKVPGVSTIEEWAENTAKDPDFGIKTPWLPHPNNATLKDVILAIRESLGVAPHLGFKNGEAGIIAPNGKVSAKRLKSMLKSGADAGVKVKYY